MGISCVITDFGEFYSVTDSPIVHLLGNYIGYGGSSLEEIAENEICGEKLVNQFDVFCRDIRKVLFDHFSVKKKIDDYDEIALANMIIEYRGGDDNNYYRNCLIAIIKLLQTVKQEIEVYTMDDGLIKDRNCFAGEAAYLHLLLLHIQEFAGEVATVKTGKNYRRIGSNKKISAKEVFDLAKRLPRGQTYTNEMTPMYESIFLIRQAIELKVMESLCICFVINKKYERPIKISPDVFIDLLDNNSVKLKNAEGNMRRVDTKFIKRVHSWTNLFVHSGNGYWFWEVEFVRIALLKFIFDEIVIEKAYLEQIPNKVLECVRESERLDAEVVMMDRYHKMVR